ncbi:hypothetical protein [Mariniphaga sp.]|uniref:hypothetical protein n=1 Tax=Mariniphaga sp. TaxID=1954475 RepID=UPI0035666FCB
MAGKTNVAEFPFFPAFNQSLQSTFLSTNPNQRTPMNVLFFPDFGEGTLYLEEYNSDFTLKWMDVRKGERVAQKKVAGGKLVNLKTPGENEWVGVVFNH